MDYSNKITKLTQTLAINNYVVNGKQENKEEMLDQLTDRLVTLAQYFTDSCAVGLKQGMDEDTTAEPSIQFRHAAEAIEALNTLCNSVIHEPFMDVDTTNEQEVKAAVGEYMQQLYHDGIHSPA